MAMRVELMEPGLQIFSNPEIFNMLVSYHGIVMIFFTLDLLEEAGVLEHGHRGADRQHQSGFWADFLLERRFLVCARFERGRDGVRANWPNRASVRDS